MPRAFSWEQLGIMVLLAGLLIGLYVWREHPGAGPPPRPAPVFVAVRGEGVGQPGVYAFDAPPLLREALARAGAPLAALSDNPPLSSGTLVTVEKDGRPHLGRMAGGRLLTLGLPLDLNQAAAQDLERLPGLGPELARRIILHRQEHGPFQSLEELGQVKGIGPNKLAQLKPYVILAPPEEGVGGRSGRRPLGRQP